MVGVENYCALLDRVTDICSVCADYFEAEVVMFIFLLVSLVITGVAMDVVFIFMMGEVNDRLPEGSRLSWWSHDFRRVNRTYREFFPDSNLPDLSQYGGYIVLALFFAMILSSILMKG